MKEKNVIPRASDVNYTTPDSAYNAGELWYKKKFVNAETNEEFYQVRPIFVVDNGEKNQHFSTVSVQIFSENGEVHNSPQRSIGE